MGNNCCGPRNKEYPLIISNYDYNNMKQKEYIKNFESYVKRDQSINYVENDSNKFSIILSIFAYKHIIKNDYDLSPGTIPMHITTIHNIIKQTINGSYYHQHIENEDFFNNKYVLLPSSFFSKKNIEGRVKNKIINTDDNEKKNIILEDMCIYGNMMKKEIQEEKLKNPGKFIEIKDALKMEKKDQGLFALGLLANILEQNGTEVVIDNDNKEEENDVGTTCLQFITNGLGHKTSYGLHFDFGIRRNQRLLNDKNEYEKFKERLKDKLSKDYNIPKNKIIVTCPQKGSFRVQVIFQSDDFNNLNIKDFTEKFKNDNDFPDLQNLKYIQQDVILSGCKLSKGQLDARGNRVDGWGVNEKRGGKPYDPPIGWKGIGLRVTDKYDNGNNTWIGMDNSKGEWCVAYHGVGRNLNSPDVKKITGLIVKGGFEPGKNQACKEYPDLNHPGRNVGEGVYCTPKINKAETYSGVSQINDKKYKTVLMVRVKPDALRYCKKEPDYWVVNGTTDEIRPYRILYKEC